MKARSARGVYYGSIRDREGRLGATVHQEQLLLPGHAADMLREQAEQAAQAAADREAAVDTREPADVRQAHDRHPSGH